MEDLIIEIKARLNEGSLEDNIKNIQENKELVCLMVGYILALNDDINVKGIKRNKKAAKRQIN